MATPASNATGQSWTTEDLIDFESLLLAESSNGDDAATRRAVESFQAEVLPAIQASGPPSRRDVFRAWLQFQRQRGGQPLPGEYWKSAWQASIVLNIVAGAVLGGSVTAALLFYRGEVPVNVPWFLACTVGIQLLILVVAAAFWLMRSATRWFDGFHPLRSLYSGLIWAMSAGLRKLPGERRATIQTIWSRLSRRRDVYGSLATWPFVVVTQAFGIWFNVGILVVLLAQISFKDIDFGWQSSFVESDSAAYRLTTTIASPWSWFAPHPHPTLAEVAESHFTFKQARSNKSWWPFLCYMVVCYGLLPRLLLLVFAAGRWRRALRRLAFDHEGCPSLYRRLVGYAVHSRETAEHDPLLPFSPKPRSASSGDAALLVAAEIEADRSRLAQQVSHAFGWNIRPIQTAKVDHPSGNEALFDVLTAQAERLAGVVVVIPAERPPIKAIAMFLERLARAMGSHPQIVLLLVGTETADSFGEIDRETLRYWQNFVAANNLNVSLETWSGT